MIYVRQSLDRTGHGDAVERQREDCERLAHGRGWAVLRVVEDNDTSAAGKTRRPGFEDVLDLLTAGRVQAVVAWDLSRLTRNARDRLRLLEAGRTAGATIALARGSDMDLSTPAGRLTADVLASVAQHEIEQKSDRQRRAGEQRRGRGEALWTRRPFGYDRGPGGSAVVVEREAAALRDAAQLVLDGATLASVVRHLNASGVRTTLDGPWNVTGLRRVLLNPRVTGAVTHHGQVVGDGQWPAILEPETQARLVDVLRDPRRRMQQGVEPRHLLSGIARCGVCGARLYSQPQVKGDRRWLTYACRNGARHVGRHAGRLDELIERVIIGRLSRPDAAALLVPSVDVDALRREADEIRHRRAALTQLLGEGLADVVTGREQLTRLTAQLEDVQARIDAACGTSPAAALLGVDDVRATWDALDVAGRRRIVEALLDVAVLASGKGARFDPKDVRITWRTA